MMYASRLAELRKQRMITQEDVARLLKISRSAYASYETARRQINHEALCLLADFYAVSTDYLLGRTEAVPSFLSEEERRMIEQLRALDERGRRAVKNTISYEYSAVTAERGKKAAI